MAENEQAAQPTEMTGAEIVVQALADQGVRHIFGYPGGAVLPIYDALFKQDVVEHFLVRHEQGAAHAAEGERGVAQGVSPQVRTVERCRRWRRKREGRGGLGHATVPGTMRP